MKVVLVLLLAEVALLCCTLPLTKHRQWQRNDEEAAACHDADVLILGAGMAGISAGYTLGNASNGTTNFIILEAGVEIGGRMKRKVLEKSGTRIELGANWIQGIDPVQPEKHPVYRIAQECGGIKGFYMKRELNSTHRFYDLNGVDITNSKELQQRTEEWFKAEKKIGDESIRRSKAGLPDISVRTALEENGWKPQTPVDNAIEWLGIDFEYADTPERTSLQSNLPEPTYYSFGDPSRIIDFFITDQDTGYAGVVQCIAKRYLAKDDRRLHLGSVVKEITWNDSCVCALTAEEGKNMRRYCAPYAIFTFSIGVLKSKMVKFEPELPEKKQKAINHIISALYLKIYLEFEKTFWPTDVNYILHADPDRGHFVHFQSLSQAYPGQPSILMATVTGRWAESVYSQTTEETQSQIMQVLRKLYGSNVPDPIEITVPDWGVNPAFMGMYSDLPTGYGPYTDDFTSPAGRLHFGGEATNDDFSGYVHGAYFSGIDAANQVIDAMRSTN